MCQASNTLRIFTLPKPLVRLSLPAPGRLGFNADQSSSVANHEWSLDVENALVNESDRLESRKGWDLITATGNHSDDTEVIHEYIIDKDSTEIISAAGTAIYEGTTTLTDVSGTATLGGADWQFLNFNGKCLGWRGGDAPIIYTGTTFSDLGATNQPTGNCAISSHGRIWAMDSDQQTLKICDTLDETTWSISVDLKGVWPGGLDTVVSLVVFQDRLIIFGERSTLIYTGLEAPASDLTLVDTINEGIASRDAVVSTGTDLIFLSRSGLRSFNRAIQYEELPFTSLAPQARQLLIQQVDSAIQTTGVIKMAYHRPIGGIVARIGANYWFIDIKQSEFVRLFEWNGQNYAWTAATSIGEALYYGVNSGIGEYSNHDDNGTGYRMIWRSPWLPVDDGGRFFIPKRAIVYVAAGLPTQFALRWSWDYEPGISSETKALDVPSPSEYEPDDTPASSPNNEYGTAEYGPRNTLLRQPYNMSGFGSLLQIGFEVEINGALVSVQQLDLFGKIGRLYR